MMMITRTNEHLEVGLADRTLSIDVDRIRGASLTAERTGDGRLLNCLVLLLESGAAPVRIEGSFAILREVQQYIIEIMQEACGRLPRPVPRTGLPE
jgi:hypothetical protein